MIKKGDTISIFYIGSLGNGSVFDSNMEEWMKLQFEQRGEELPAELPAQKGLEFEVWAGMMIEGFDKSVVGKKEGDDFTITIPCAEAYGEKDPDAVQSIPRSVFGEVEIEVGQIHQLQDPESWMVYNPVVLEISDDEVKMDFNHMLAWEDLTFRIVIDKIVKSADAIQIIT